MVVASQPGSILVVAVVVVVVSLAFDDLDLDLATEPDAAGQVREKEGEPSRRWRGGVDKDGRAGCCGEGRGRQRG